MRSWLVGAVAGLAAASTPRVRVDRDLPAAMPDGVVLLADGWYPDGADVQQTPILLARSPYGRMDLYARLFAERGYQTVIVSCRGTFGCGGCWEPFRNEHADDHAVLDWLAKQSWFHRNVAVMGPSYLGLTQWAVAGGPAPPSWLKALVPAADTVAVGRHVDYYRDWLSHSTPDDPWWGPVSFGRDVNQVPPTRMMAGWYDIFLPHQLADFRALRQAGRTARLSVGPWQHTSPSCAAAVQRDALDWADTHLRAQPHGRDAAVRVFVMGAKRWTSLPE